MSTGRVTLDREEYDKLKEDSRRLEIIDEGGIYINGYHGYVYTKDDGNTALLNDMQELYQRIRELETSDRPTRGRLLTMSPREFRRWQKENKNRCDKCGK